MSRLSPSKLWLQIGNRFTYHFRKGLKDGLRARITIIDELACCDADRIYTQAIGGVALHKKEEKYMTPLYMYVPPALVESYQTSANWSSYASQFRAINVTPKSRTWHLWKGENEMDIVKKTCENCGWADISACEKCNPSTHSQWLEGKIRRSTIRYGDMYTKPGQSRIPDIKKVIFNNPATIVFWADGSKTVVKCQEGDYYDEEMGLAMAIAKKALGNNGSYYKVFDKWLPEE